MKKYSTILLAILIVLGVIFYLWTAISAKKQSEELMSKFKEIDNTLAASIDTSLNQKGISAIEEVYLNSSSKSHLILLIDSLKEKYENQPESSKPIETSSKLRTDIKRLLVNVQQFNKFKWDMVDSNIPDTIKYWSDLDKFSEQKWFSMHFENMPKEVSITYLNYLRNQILTIN